MNNMKCVTFVGRMSVVKGFSFLQTAVFFYCSQSLCGLAEHFQFLLLLDLKANQLIGADNEMRVLWVIEKEQELKCCSLSPQPAA